MSLVKSYTIACQGPSLAARRGVLKSGPGVLFHDHTPVRLAASDTAAKARREALKGGWSRAKVNLPILESHPDAGSTVVAFDLCPSCTETLKDLVQ